ncbi:hypothetical protein Lal_00047740 [Lupinus albus]|nr:hypothetical protein Lal_00047740 [Lupinus albus]
MTRDNLYWLSHDQVALFKTFRGTASRRKQTINHAVPRIKQPRSLLYDILLHCKNRSRIHPKYGYQCQFRNTHNIGISYSNSSATERKGEKEAGNASAENIEGERKEQVNSYLLLVQKIMKEEVSIYRMRFCHYSCILQCGTCEIFSKSFNVGLVRFLQKLPMWDL